MVLDVSGHDAERVVDWLNFYNKYEGGRASRVGNRASTIVSKNTLFGAFLNPDNLEQEIEAIIWFRVA